MTTARPGIYKLGRVHDDGHTVTVSGWGLSLCAAGCDCHRSANGQLTIAATNDGTLGLTSHRVCDCCSPWTVDELAAVLRDVVDVGALEATG